MVTSFSICMLSPCQETSLYCKEEGSHNRVNKAKSADLVSGSYPVLFGYRSIKLLRLWTDIGVLGLEVVLPPLHCFPQAHFHLATESRVKD